MLVRRPFRSGDRRHASIWVHAKAHSAFARSFGLPTLSWQCLRIRLAEIAVEAQNEENERKRQAELGEMRASLKNTTGARSTMLGLVQSGSPIAWAPPIVSVVVTLGFFVFVIILLFHGLQVNDRHRDKLLARLLTGLPR